MGMFRNMKEMVGVARSDELKQLKRMADAQPRVSMMEGVRMANEALAQAQQGQAPPPGAIQGSATVKGMADAGTRLNDAPIMDVELEVELPGEPPYTVTHRQLIGLAALPNWQIGKVWPVHVDPADRTKLTIG